MAERNRRMRIMEAVDEKMEEVSEDFSEYRNLHEEIDDLEDEIERYYKGKEGYLEQKLVGTIKEPSLVLCWFLLACVVLYVVVIGLQPSFSAPLKDEL